MYGTSEARNWVELIKHLKLYQFDEGGLLPGFMTSEYEAMILVAEVEKDSDDWYGLFIAQHERF